MAAFESQSAAHVLDCNRLETQRHEFRAWRRHRSILDKRGLSKSHMRLVPAGTVSLYIRQTGLAKAE